MVGQAAGYQHMHSLRETKKRREGGEREGGGRESHYMKHVPLPPGL